MCGWGILYWYLDSVIIFYKGNTIYLLHTASAANECDHLITIISTPLAFVFGIICGLFLYQCGVKCTCETGNRRHSDRAESHNTNVTLQPNKDEDLVIGSNEEVNNASALYEEIPDGRCREKQWSCEQNVAYGQFHTYRGACN